MWSIILIHFLAECFVLFSEEGDTGNGSQSQIIMTPAFLDYENSTVTMRTQINRPQDRVENLQ